MRFGILGHLEVVGDDGFLHVRGRMRRLLLQRLLVDPNAVVTSDTLVEDVWSGLPPPGATAGDGVGFVAGDLGT